MAAVTVCVLAVGVTVAVRYLPTRTPTEATSQRYQPLAEHRAVRADERAEAIPASLLVGAAAAPTVQKPQTFPSPLRRLRIKTIGVDAAVEIRNLEADGVMQSPTSPDLVAWYGFTPKPGVGGNAVLSGHVDYINKGPAVFWDLKKLVDGDSIEAVLEDGTIIQYAVSAQQSYPIETIPMADVLAPTSTESLTLITCGGAFSGGKYTHRLVLRATKTAVIKPG